MKKKTIINKLDLHIDFLKKHVDLDCPLKSDYIFRDIKRNSDNSESLKYSKLNLLGNFDLITRDNPLEESKVIGLFNRFVSLVNNKAEEAKSEGKDLLILIGESHESQSSLLLELAILTYLKSKTILSNLLVEQSAETVSSYYKYSDSAFGFHFIEGEFIAKNLLNYKLISIDPLHEIGAEGVLGDLRDIGINKAILETVGVNSVAIVGSKHLGHIITDESIKDNFVVLPLDTSSYENKQPRIIQQLTQSLKGLEGYFSKPQDSRIYLEFEQSIESFSVKDIYNIYEYFLPLFLGETFESNNRTFKPDFPSNLENCKGFLDIIKEFMVTATPNMGEL